MIEAESKIQFIGQIGRHTRDFVIDVKPCKDYAFRVSPIDNIQNAQVLL